MGSFLARQAVVVGGKKSILQDVKNGAAQGTVRGPFFFILCVIEMILVANNSKALTVADDTQLMKKIAQLLLAMPSFKQIYTARFSGRQLITCSCTQTYGHESLPEQLKFASRTPFHCKLQTVFNDRWRDVRPCFVIWKATYQMTVHRHITTE